MLMELLGIEMAELKKEDLIEPEYPIEEGETIMGKMTEKQIKLYTIATKMKKAAAEAAIEAKFGRDNKLRGEAAKRTIEAKAKADIIMNIMWADIKDTCDLWEYPSIGIRQGYKVTANKSEPPSFLDFLRSTME